MTDPMVKLLLERRYPHHLEYQWEDRDEPHYVPPRQFKTLDAEIDAYERMLRHLEPEFLTELYERERKKLRPAAAERAWRELQVYNLEDEEAAPDYAFWVKAEIWELEEAVALTVGIDPKRLNTRIAKARQTRVKVAKDFLRLLDFAERAVRAGTLQSFVTPTAFSAWISNYKHLANALFLASTQHFADLSYDNAESERQCLKQKIKQLEDKLEKKHPDHTRTMERVILSWAIRHNYKPDDKRSLAIGKIFQQIEGYMKVDKGTLLAIVRRAFANNEENAANLSQESQNLSGIRNDCANPANGRALGDRLSSVQSRTGDTALRPKEYVSFPNTALQLPARRLERLFDLGPPHWRDRRTRRPAKAVSRAVGQQAKDIRRLRKADDARAMPLADLMDACCSAYPCGSAACAVCWRAFQRLFVRAGRPLKPRFAGPMSAVSIVLGGRILLGELAVSHFLAAATAVRQGLEHAKIPYVAGGLDINVNEDGENVAPYWALQAWLIMPRMLAEQDSQLRKALEKHRRGVQVPVHVQDFDGDNAGLAYALKGDFVRRQTIIAHVMADGGRVRQDTRDRHLKVEQEVELLLVRHDLGFESRLLLHNVSLRRNGRFRLPKA